MSKPITIRTRGGEGWWIAGAFAATLALALLLTALPERLSLLALVVGLAAPVAAVAMLRGMRGRALVLLIALVPLTGIFKALTGSRFAPLIFDLGILAACGLHLLDAALRGRARVGWADLLFAGFVGLAFVQMFNPNVPGLQAGAEGFRKFAYMGVAFYAGRHMLAAPEVGWLQRLLLILSGPIALYAIKQFFLPSAIDYRIIDLATADPVTYLMGGRLRPFATLPGPFHLGLYLVATGLLAVRLLLGRRLRPIWALALVGLLALQMTALIMTRTKGNWVAMGAGVLLLALLASGSAAGLLQRARRLAAALALAGLLGAILLGLALSGRFPVLSDALSAVLDPLNAPTFVYRVQLWQQEMLPAMSASPLFGWGTSSAGEGLGNLYAGVPGARYFASHNLYFKITLELGAVGLALFLGLVGLCLWRGWRVARGRVSAGLPAETTQWALAVVVGFLIAGLAAPVLDAYPANYYFWLLLGLLARAPRDREPAPATEPAPAP